MDECSRASEWLCVYAYPKFARTYLDLDLLVSEFVPEVLVAARNQGIPFKYFFLRYPEGGLHLRLRLGASAIHRRVLCDLVKCVAAAYSAAHENLSLTWPDYEPEVDRYGGPAGVAIAENHFQASSDLVLEWIKAGAEHAESRAAWCLLANLTLLHTFGDNFDFVVRFVESILRVNTGARSPRGQALNRAAAAIPASGRALVRRMRDAVRSGELPVPFRLFQQELLHTRAELYRSVETGHLKFRRVSADWSTARHSLLPSYMHMLNNRFGFTNAQELELYSVLATVARDGDD